MSPVSMFQCWDLIDLLLTSAGAGQSASTASTDSTASNASNTSTAGLARVGETAEVVDALAAFQCSVADLEIEISSVKI